MNTTYSTLDYLLEKKQSMLQFHLLKFLKYKNILKFSLVCKGAGRVCDANNT